MSTLEHLKACTDEDCPSTLHYKLYEKGDSRLYLEWLERRIEKEGETTA